MRRSSPAVRFRPALELVVTAGCMLPPIGLALQRRSSDACSAPGFFIVVEMPAIPAVVAPVVASHAAIRTGYSGPRTLAARLPRPMLAATLSQ